MSLMTKEEYIASLRKSKKRIFLGGAEVGNYVDHPIIRPSINACAATYDLCRKPEYEELMTATSSLTGARINRFTHLHQSADDLVKKVKMQRLLGQKTGCCFQRCVGFDGFNAVDSVTYEMDQEARHGIQSEVPCVFEARSGGRSRRRRCHDGIPRATAVSRRPTRPTRISLSMWWKSGPTGSSSGGLKPIRRAP